MGKQMNAVQVSRIADMLPKKAVLAVAVAGAMFAAGQVVAAPVSLKLATQRASISTQATDAGTKAMLWTLDEMGNPTPNDSAKTVTVMAGTATASLTFPKGSTAIEFMIGAGKTVDVTNMSGNVTLTAEFALGTPNTITDSSTLNITADSLLGAVSSTFADATPAGTLLSPAFTTSTLAGATVANTAIKVMHVTEGLGSIPAEIIPSTTTNATGALSLTFTNASGNVTTPSNEYYVLSDVSGVLADAIVANVGDNAIADIVAGAAKSVILSDATGNELGSIEAPASGAGFAVDLSAQKYLAMDAYGNVVTPATVTISGTSSEVGGTYLAGVVSYDGSFAGSQDNLTVNFSAPVGASLMLDVLSPGTDPLLDDLSIVDDTADTNIDQLTPDNFLAQSDMEIRGGSAVDGGLYQVVTYAKRSNTLSTRFSVKPDSADVGKAVDYKLLLGWFSPTGGIAYYDFGAGQFWNYDLSSLGAFTSNAAVPAGLTPILDLSSADFFYDAFPAGSEFMWITGYELTDNGNPDQDTLHLGAAWLVNGK